MKKVLVSIVFALILLASLHLAPLTSEATSNRTIVIAVDLSHGESDKYLDYIIGNITEADGYPIEWRKITEGPITASVLADVDILLIGQPTVAFSSDEIEAIKNWLNTGNKVLYVAGDSDYGGGPNTIEAVNVLLDSIGAKLRLEQASAYSVVNYTYTYKGVEYPTCAKAYYRMLAFVEPDNVPSLYTSILDKGVTKPILMHGPGAVIWMDEEGNYRDPVNETFDGLVRIAWFRNSYIGDNNAPSPYVYDPLDYGQGTGNWSFVAYAAEYWKDKNVVITVAGESLYGDYEPAWASSYYGVELDGPRFVTNLVRWWVKLITVGPLQPASKVLEFVDPEGDDDGTGTLTYPTNSVFQPGAFDIVKFEVWQDNVYVYFKTYFRNLGGNPWGGPNGFSLQHLQIYVLTTMANLPLNKATFGLNVEISYGWNYAFVAIPGWGDQPYPDGEVSAMFAGDGSRVADEKSAPDMFDAYAEDNAIVVKVAKSLLQDVENINKWKYVVTVASYDGYGEMKIRGINPGDSQEWAFGGADSLAVLAGVQPKIIDLWAPTAQAQYDMLKSYDTEAKKLAQISGVALQVETTTPTTTPPETTTPPATTTPPQETTPATTSPAGFDYTTIAIIIIILVIIVAAALMLFKKPKPKTEEKK